MSNLVAIKINQLTARKAEIEVELANYDINELEAINKKAAAYISNMNAETSKKLLELFNNPLYSASSLLKDLKSINETLSHDWSETKPASKEYYHASVEQDGVLLGSIYAPVA